MGPIRTREVRLEFVRGDQVLQRGIDRLNCPDRLRILQNLEKLVQGNTLAFAQHDQPGQAGSLRHHQDRKTGLSIYPHALGDTVEQGHQVVRQRNPVPLSRQRILVDICQIFFDRDSTSCGSLDCLRVKFIFDLDFDSDSWHDISLLKVLRVVYQHLTNCQEYKLAKLPYKTLPPLVSLLYIC